MFNFMKGRTYPRAISIILANSILSDYYRLRLRLVTSQSSPYLPTTSTSMSIAVLPLISRLCPGRQCSATAHARERRQSRPSTSADRLAVERRRRKPIESVVKPIDSPRRVDLAEPSRAPARRPQAWAASAASTCLEKYRPTSRARRRRARSCRAAPSPLYISARSAVTPP